MAMERVLKRRIKRTLSDKVFDTVNIAFMLIVFVVTIYPLYFVIIASISDPYAVNQGKTLLLPYGISFTGYSEIFNDVSMWSGYKNTIIYTVLGTLISIALTMTCAFGLSIKGLPAGKVITWIIIFTMLFDGGMVPRYFVVRDLHMIDTIWALVIPRAAWVFTIIIARTFIQQSIPHEIFESAQCEGCSLSRYFFSIVVPLSSALVAILVLYYGVANWNSFFDAMIYLNKQSMVPLSLVLRNILIANQMNMFISAGSADELDAMIRKAETVKYVAVIFSSLPILCLYPFLQKYFVKGIMIGAIKG